MQPDGAGRAQPRGRRFYDRLVDGLLERGIEPVATLYHWDLPQALAGRAAAGPSRDTAERFAEYAAARGTRRSATACRAGSRSTSRGCATFLGYAQGAHAPGMRDWPTALRRRRTTCCSRHGLAVRALRAPAPASVGITLNLSPACTPAGDRRRGRRPRDLGRPPQPLVPDPVLRGALPRRTARALRGPRRTDRARSATATSTSSHAPIDFLGVNYYFAARGARRPATQSPLGFGARRRAARRVTAMGWEVEPDGLHELLVRLRRDYGDLPRSYITENGAAFDDEPAPDGRVDDPDRVAYLEGHLDAVARRDRGRRRRPRLLRLVAAGQLRVGRGLRQALRDRPRRLRDAAAHAQGSGDWYRDLIARTRNARRPD